MRTKLIIFSSTTIVVFLIIVPFLVFGETEVPLEFSIPGRIEKTGIYFEIQDSEYLNITLESSEEIKVVLESIPRMISLDVERVTEGINSTKLTLEGLEPNKTYYKYQNSYKNGAVFVSDENGSYSWTQDLIQSHHVWIQEIKGTIFLPEKENKYGIWDEPTRTYTLNQDLTENVEMIESNFTFDGNGHSISGKGTGYGIHLSWEKANNVIIKNTIIENFGDGILLWFSWGIKIENNHILNNSGNGLHLISSSETILNNEINSNQNSGIYYYARGGETISGLIRGNDISNNEFGMYLNNQGGWVGGSSIVDNILSSNDYGFFLTGTYSYDFSSNNKIKNNYFLNNTLGLYLTETTKDNVIYHNNFLNNIVQVYNEGFNNLFDNDYSDGGNYWSDYIGVDSNGDGIGDTPYIFTGGQDRYPFMQENGWETSPVPTYDVAVILAEPNDISHISSSITAQPCKLISAEKIYPNGRNKEYFEDLLYCVADYHKENSFGTVNLSFTIYDNNGEWFRIDKSEQDYLNNEQEFVIDVVNSAENTGVDLSGYDMVVALHSGEAAKTIEDRGEKLNTMTWGLISQPLGYPPYKIIVAEDDLVGGWAHEIGHVIGALQTLESTIIPDLYNMGLSSVFTLFGESYDILYRGAWDIMSSGAWNENGNNPPYMSSFTKEFLGWLNYDIYPKSAYGEYWVNSLETNNYGDSVFRYNLSDDTQDDSSKYYILETRNRNLKTWDSSLPGLPVVGDKNLVLYYVDTKDLPEYGYVSAGIEGYQEGMMWNQYRNISIPGGYSINDGILNLSVSETYRDLDNLVKFSAITDRTVNDKYEIQARIEEITYDSFDDKFWGVILRPKSTFKKWIEGIFNPNSIKTLEFYKVEDTSIKTQLAVAYFNPETGKWEGGLPLRPATRDEIKEKINRVSIILILIILFNVFLICLNIKIIPQWKSERYKKIAKNIFKIFLVLSIIAFIIFVVFLCFLVIVYMSAYRVGVDTDNFKNISNNHQRLISAPLLEPTTLPDLDLHVYCGDDRHVGINYETGEYEIQIPGAIVSGDNQNAPEWIFIPEDIINCHFVVSSYDNQKFLEENLEIVQEIGDTSDSYEVYARYIDPETGIYTSPAIFQEIEAGVQLEHSITGIDDITINFGEVTIDSIIGEIYQYFNLGWIDEVGIKESLLSQLNNAKRKIEANQEQVAISILNAFINEVEAQRNRHIKINATEILIKNTKEVINHL